MKQGLVLLLFFIPFCGCTQNAPISSSSEKPNNHSDSLIYTTDDCRLYLSCTEYTDIILSKTDPSTMDFGRFRIPTKGEAELLRTLSVPTTTEQRLLCIAPDGYYTFRFIKGSHITKAGEKTKYAIRPIRVVYNPKDTIIEL